MKVKGWTIFVALLLLVSGCAPKTSGNDVVYDTYVAGETVDLGELHATIVRVSYQQSVMSLLEYGNRVEPFGADLEYLDVVLEVENIGKTGHRGRWHPVSGARRTDRSGIPFIYGQCR